MKNKLFKYNKVSEFSNVFEHDKDDLNKELSEILKNFSKVVVEIGCGKGEYTVALAQDDPNSLYIGIDIKGDRIYKGARLANENNLNNVYFVRMRVHELAEVFPENSIDEIWITFPDPYPKDRQEKKRLTFSRFLEYYKFVLKNSGYANLKTDNTALFEYSINSVKDFGCKVIEINRDVYKDDEPDYPLGVETYYEKKHKALGETIKYLKFRY
jgi:tRNA (guanine-N7-)-methyltransferase